MGACGSKTDVKLELQRAPVRFDRVGPGIKKREGGRGVLQTTTEEYDTNAFALASPVLRSGTASATFRLVFKGEAYIFQIGLFPADHKLVSHIESADGKRCALWVYGGLAKVLCDGEKSDPIYDIGLRSGDTVTVRVAFEDATTARVTLLFRGRTQKRTLQDVPACGLRFGVGLCLKESGVTLVASSVATSWVMSQEEKAAREKVERDAWRSEPKFTEQLGPGLVLVDCGRGVKQMKQMTHGFALAGPILRSGTASAAFKLVFKGGDYIFVVGVFPASSRLDSSIVSAEGKRCALKVGSASGGCARVLCDGEKSDLIQNIGVQPGDTIKVDVTFTDATTARVTFHSSSDVSNKLAALGRTLEGVPACGLCFGTGLWTEGSGVSLVASSVDADPVAAAAAVAAAEKKARREAEEKARREAEEKARQEAARREAEEKARCEAEEAAARRLHAAESELQAALAVPSVGSPPQGGAAPFDLERLERAITEAKAAGVEERAIQSAEGIAIEQRRVAAEAAVGRLTELQAGAVARIDVDALKAAITEARSAGVDRAAVRTAEEMVVVSEGRKRVHAEQRTKAARTRNELHSRLLQFADETGGMYEGEMDTGPRPSRFLVEPRQLVFGQPVEAARGVEHYMNVPLNDVRRGMIDGIDAIRREIARLPDEKPERYWSAGAVAKECLQYVLQKEAGSDPITFQDGLKRDCDERGNLLPSRRRSDGRGMRLADFVALPVSRQCNLEEAEVAGIRLYSTAAFEFINNPLRDQERRMRGEPHPLPITVAFIREGLKKLRAVGADSSAANTRVDLYRGMKNVAVPTDFLAKGGTELAPMSTTSNLKVTRRI